MYFIYSILFTTAFVLMLPLFLLRREKYAAGFHERLGRYSKFQHDGRPVIWLHCVSVGETNAARPLVDSLGKDFPGYRLIISTITKTGQALARDIFNHKADAVFYFPFDLKFSVRRALDNFKPSVVLLMETEIWPRFTREAKRTGSKIAIVNGRLSEKSFRRYLTVRPFLRRVLAKVDLALMQGEKDEERIISLGMDVARVSVTGNMKFDHSIESSENSFTEEFRERFGTDGGLPLIVAGSTHEPEEEWVLDALKISGCPFRVLFAPRHPQRFDAVADMIKKRGCSHSRRSDAPRETDKTAEVILLDSVGELRSIYPLADIVFVGGSLIPHGGQSFLEPAAAGRAIITGWHMENFDTVTSEFVARRAMIQMQEPRNGFKAVDQLFEAFTELLGDEGKRRRLGETALRLLEANRGATTKTRQALASLLHKRVRVSDEP